MCIHRYRYISNHSYVVHIQSHRDTRMTLQYRYSIDLFRDRGHRWGHTHLYSHNHRFLRSSLGWGRQFLSMLFVKGIFVDPWLITIDASTFIRANSIFTLTQNWARICHAFIHISTSITILSITQLRKIYTFSQVLPEVSISYLTNTLETAFSIDTFFIEFVTRDYILLTFINIDAYSRTCIIIEFYNTFKIFKIVQVRETHLFS